MISSLKIYYLSIFISISLCNLWIYVCILSLRSLKYEDSYSLRVDWFNAISSICAIIFMSFKTGQFYISVLLLLLIMSAISKRLCVYTFSLMMQEEHLNKFAFLVSVHIYRRRFIGWTGQKPHGFSSFPPLICYSELIFF